MTYQELITELPKDWTIDQSIVLGWHDGPVSGVCQLEKPKYAFEYKILAFTDYTSPEAGGHEMEYLYRIRQVPYEKTISLLTELLGSYEPPTRPIWTPLVFVKDQEEYQANQAIIKKILGTGNYSFVLRTKDIHKGHMDLWEVIEYYFE